MQFKFNNEDVAEVSVETDGFIRLKKPGSTSLQLRQVVGKDVVILASSILVVTPALPGRVCDNFFFHESSSPSALKIVDCSGKCVSPEEVALKLEEVRLKHGDVDCDDGSQGIDLSCAFIPGLFSQVLPQDLQLFTNSDNREGGGLQTWTKLQSTIRGRPWLRVLSCDLWP
jgi:hypothetical protein